VDNHGDSKISSDNGADPSPEAELSLLRNIYPDFCAELISLLNAEKEPDLAVCAHDLRIVAPCGCGDDFCQSFYTAPRPKGAYGPGHRNIVLLPTHGMIVLDVVHDRIMFVEVLHHPPLSDRTVATLSAEPSNPE
jgi:hypothetical protein